ncbi:hypothetical protein RBE51_20730 [Pseudomonas taiwanensis]|uniref:hypothetical protein n=1 Tax=Pseudomonas taiwanensis TaxID=470150 RepID=UPI0028DF49C1|nr:hypothetical protein [Pseudomonas taiwanensis]MDT8925222.1 hypothetical protein [Pseudomonas taiwanensis]
MSQFRTECPTSKTTEKFVQFVDVGGKRQKMPFEREVVWVQESETTLLFMHGGKVVRQGPVTNDYYGYLTSFTRTDAHGAELLAQEYGVTPESTLEIHLVTTITRRPCLETEADQVANGEASGQRRQYSHLPDTWRQETVVDGEVRYLDLEAVTVATGLVWSSKNAAEQNASLAQAFAQQWAAQ